jgi:hypothetical protein
VKDGYGDTGKRSLEKERRYIKGDISKEIYQRRYIKGEKTARKETQTAGYEKEDEDMTRDRRSLDGFSL